MFYRRKEFTRGQPPREIVSFAIRRAVLFLVAMGVSHNLAAQTNGGPYAGKQIRFVIASGAEGGYDAYSRILALHLGDHIPGRPSIVVENMPGAGGMVGINWAYNAAPKDGTVLFASFNGIPYAKLFGNDLAKFDPRDLVSIGSIGKQQDICSTWYTDSVKTIAQARQQEVTVSAEGPGSNSATLPLIANSMLGTKFKIVTGYSTTGMRLAAQNGEVQGICGLSWATLKASSPDWVTNHRLNILFQTGEKAQSDLPDAPVLIDLVLNAEDKKIVRLLEYPGELGRPLFMPPGTPKFMSDVIRKAFDETMADPAFLQDAKKAMVDVDPIGGEEMHRIIMQAYETPRPIVERAGMLAGIPHT